MDYKEQKVLRQNYKGITTIDWQLGNFCNFKCDYCFPDSNNGTIRLDKFDNVLLENLNHLKAQFQKIGKEKLLWSLSGGEPTIFHGFTDFIEWIKTQDDYVQVISNGSRSKTWWQKNIQKIDKLIISHHVKQGNIDHIVSLLDIFQNTNTSIHVMIDNQDVNLSIEHYNKLYNILSTKQNVKLKYKLLRPHPLRPDIKYSHKHLKRLSRLAHVNRNKRKNLPPSTSQIKTAYHSQDVMTDANFFYKLEGLWEGYKCWAHNEFLQIGPRGEIGKLGCGQTFHESLNIHDAEFADKFSLNTKAIICDRNIICNCLGLLYCSKERI